MTLLEVRSLVKSFPRGTWRSTRQTAPRAVDDVSFWLEGARTLAIVGESGAGKSTTGRLVLRLLEPDEGQVLLGGVDLTALTGSRLRAHRRDVQAVFQDPRGSFNPLLRMGYSVAEPLKTHLGLNRADRERAVAALFQRVGLEPRLVRAYPRELSGGQLQRVAIARALSVRPRLVVCDEVVSALDASVRARILNLLLDLQDDHGLALLFITHDLAVVEDFAHDTLVMRSGRVIEHGPTGQLFAHPREPYTAALLGAIPRLDALLDDPCPEPARAAPPEN